MSSILDALKKLERDKARERHPGREVEAPGAERDLTQQRRPAGRDALRTGPMLVVAGSILFASIIIAASVVASLLIARATVRPQVAQEPRGDSTQPALPTPPAHAAKSVAPAVEVAVAAPDPIVSVTPSNPAPSSAAAAPRRATKEPARQQAVVQKSVEAREPAGPPAAPPVAPAPNLAEAPSAVKDPPVASTPHPATEDTPIGEVDLNTLPVLSESERLRLGLPKLKVNIVGMPTKRQPRPSALINWEKVYVGEYIRNTNARLIAVDLRGIGIEVAGHRYFLP